MELLDIALHYDCNLSCVYCTITGPRRRTAGLTTTAVVQHIDRAAKAGCRALSLTGGEPTIRRDLIPIVRHAARRGFTEIKVQTNGLLLSTGANLDRLLAAGVTRIGLSVHGYDGDARRYERITRSGPGTGELLLAAIDNLVRSKVALTADLIVMTDTAPTLIDTIERLHGRGVTSFDLWFVSLTDDNANNTDSMPRLSDVLPAVIGCLDYGAQHGLQVRSLHIPRCLLGDHADRVAHPGWDRQVHVVTPDAAFELTASRLSAGAKPERCGTCRYDRVCPGLRPDYIDRFGDDELSPCSV